MVGGSRIIACTTSVLAKGENDTTQSQIRPRESRKDSNDLLKGVENWVCLSTAFEF